MGDLYTYTFVLLGGHKITLMCDMDREDILDAVVSSKVIRGTEIGGFGVRKTAVICSKVLAVEYNTEVSMDEDD